MREWFKLDSPLMQFLSRVMDLIILNLCFLLGSIPILTIGTSLTAMYHVALKMARKEEGYIVREFWKQWKANFKQSTLAWLLTIAVSLLFWIEYRQIGILPSGIKTFYRWFWAILLVVFGAGLIFLYAYMARFQDSLKICILNSWKMAILHPVYTILVLAAHGLAAVLTVWQPDTMMWMLFFWLLLGFSFFAYVESHFLRNYFSPYDGSEEEEDPEEGEES